MALSNGQVLQQRYRIEALLGQGGMGAVYRACDLRLEMSVALKEMIPQPGLDPAELAQLRDQFKQEAVVLARMSHPHLVRVTDFFEEGNNAYLVMDFVEGESLDQRIERLGALPEAEALRWAGQLLDALAYCHEQGIIHRDVKPQNIIITSAETAILVDFGLVKLWNPDDPRTKTVMQGIGTPEYAPPEQYSARFGHTDPRSDIYSLGATMYHALTGQAPPTATDRMVEPSLLQVPRMLNPRISPRSELTIMQAMEPRPADRYASAQEMKAALMGSPPAPRPTTVIPQSSPPPSATQRKGIPVWIWAVGGAGLLLLLVLCIGAISALSRLPAALAPTPTRVRATAAASPTPAQQQPTAIPSPTPVPAQEPTGTAPPSPIPPTATSAPTEEPAPQAGDVQDREVDGAEMIYVPAGDFLMGSTNSDEMAADFEKPQHTVYLDSFWIDRTEVTVAQYQACVQAGSCSQPAQSSSSTRSDYFGNTAFGDYPILWVSWYDADAYCRWAGARLPTEAEWEKAARGDDGRVFPWGNTWDENRTNAVDRLGDTRPVGSFPSGASPYGVLDMAGNVWEWVADWYDPDYYASSPERNPQGPRSGDQRGVRSGSWYSRLAWQRAPNRGSADPSFADDDIGFRCAQDAAD